MLRNMMQRFFKSSSTEQQHVIERSNVIQYDEMGYPLRLVMIDRGDGTVDHVWRDTVEQDGDVVLEWEEAE